MQFVGWVIQWAIQWVIQVMTMTWLTYLEIHSFFTLHAFIYTFIV